MRERNLPLVREVVMDAITFEIEYRADETRQTPGRLSGVLMPYGKKAGDRPEIFDAGALHWPSDGILVRAMHDRAQPIMRVVPELVGNEVRIDSAFPDTQMGRDSATNLRAKVYTGLSVEFNSELETRRGGLRVIQRALLTGAGLVDIPSYRDAVAEVRRAMGRRIWL